MSDRVGFNHLGQCVADLTRARRFYEELLDFQFWREISPPDHTTAKLSRWRSRSASPPATYDRDGLVLELLHFSDPSHRRAPAQRAMDEPGLTHISLSCDIEGVCRHASPSTAARC